MRVVNQVHPPEIRAFIDRQENASYDGFYGGEHLRPRAIRRADRIFSAICVAIVVLLFLFSMVLS